MNEMKQQLEEEKLEEVTGGKIKFTNIIKKKNSPNP
jgi:hypothetical protein